MVLLRSDCPLAPQPSVIQNPLPRGKVMKVKFKKKGRWQHEAFARGQFNYEPGDEKSGISESDAADMEKFGVADILGLDHEPSDEVESDPPKDPDPIKKESTDDDSAKKNPWDKK